MSFGEPLAPAKAGDRRRARTMIESAYAAGRLTPPDRDLRLDQARTASTQGELDALVRDLRSAPAALAPMLPVPQGGVAPVDTPPPGGGASAHYGSVLPVPQSPARIWGSGRRPTNPLPVLLGLGGFLMVGAMALSAFESTSGGGSAGASPSWSQPEVVTDRAGVPFTLDQAGFRRLVRDLDGRFGDTRVGSATLYRGYAVLDVPLPRRPRTVRSFVYRDGAFDSSPSSGRAEALVDLAEVSTDRLTDHLKAAPGLLGVKRPAQRYVLVRPDEGGTVWFYVTSADDRTGYLVTTLDGRVLRTLPAT